MLVYVISKNGKPLMPCKPAKARHLLRDGKATVLKRTPFTIKLNFDCDEVVQDVVLGVDAGSKTVGLSATTEEKELFASNVTLRNDIPGLLTERRMLRNSRRSRKTRYRKARFLNRVKSKYKGWLAPSIICKIQTHLKVIDNVCKILPISKIIVEVANFDIQKINNPDIKGKEYQQGVQLDFENVKQYILSRDEYTCQHCKGKSKDKKLNVHHIVFRSNGGSNKPDNLITLCETCHHKLHQGEIKLKQKSGKSFKDSAFMNIMKPYLVEELNIRYPNKVEITYGYITKHNRLEHNLPKDHYIDARCITGNCDCKSLDIVYIQKKVRCHNRKLHKLKINKGNYRKNNQTPRYVFGFQLFDKIEINKKEYFIFGRRNNGDFDLRDLNNNSYNKGHCNYKKIKLIEKRKFFLMTINRKK